MKFRQLALAMALISSVILVASVFAQQKPGPEIVQAGIDAYNGKDVGYFERFLADDVTLIDEDGHVVSSKSSVLGFLKNQLTDPTPRKVTPKNIKVGSTTDAAWAHFGYTMEHQGKPERTGVNSFVFRKDGSEWRIVLMHIAFDYPSH